MTSDEHNRGLLAPFRRDRKRDFASGTGVELLRSKIEQILMTRGKSPLSAGELPWRTDFGSALNHLRHQKNDAVLEELARVYVRDALQKWLPGVEAIGVEVVRDGASLRCRIRFRDHSGIRSDQKEEAKIMLQLE